MVAISQWVKRAIDSLVDPERENRVQVLVSILQQDLQSQKQSFSLANSLKGVNFGKADVDAAKLIVYRSMLERGWSDGVLTQREQDVARWGANALAIPDATARAIIIEFAREHFAVALAHAMEDGVLDAREEAQLNLIASSAGLTMQQFARVFFQSESESFLRGVFLACVADNQLSEDEWHHLLTMTNKLGITQEEFLRAVQPQARRFVEHVLADSKADGRLSEVEETTLRWLITNLALPPEFVQYVTTEVSLLRTLTRIEDGKLPSLTVPAGIEIRAGEIVHAHSESVWRQTRLLKGGPQTDDHRGTMTLTDNRLIFTSPTKSQSINYRRIVSHRGGPDRMELQIEGKPICTFFFPGRSPIPYAIFRSAVAMANQTKVVRSESLPTRHIPRDVRQRVWQRYSGQCAECGADDYLEFDHVIPVSKGGSNSDNNVQLLCRRCNLKKSDHL